MNQWSSPNGCLCSRDSQVAKPVPARLADGSWLSGGTRRFRTVLALVLVLGLGWSGVVRGADLNKPNVILILADDLGYGDLGTYGANRIRTPHLDQLAAEGMRLTDFYMASAVCSASRAALLTGCYPLRVGIPGVLSANVRSGIHADEALLSELLKRNGYATAIYGKWHLGNQPKFWPLRHGFDEWLGTIGSNDMGRGKPSLEARRAGQAGVELVHQERVIEINPDQSRLTSRYTAAAVDFIERHQAHPFFLYLAHNMPHTPLFPHPDRAGASEGGVYGAVVEEIDWSVGQVLAALDRCDLAKRTIVIFTSDNGPWLIFGNHGGSAGPLRGGKKQTWEGGHRVPLLVRWPGHVPVGAVCREPVVAFDLLPTLVQWTGSETPRKPIDGKDISALLLGRADARSPHRSIAFYDREELHAVRSGRWKLHLPHQDRHAPDPQQPGNDGVRGGVREVRRVAALYDLQQDIGETQNLLPQHPEVVAQLRQAAEQIRGELGDALTASRGRSRRAAGVFMPARVYRESRQPTWEQEVNLTASVRLADLDADDDLDLVVANGRHWQRQNWLVFNQGQARFTQRKKLGSELATSYAAEVGDLDGDGDLDIAVGNDRRTNRIFLNDGMGRFQSGGKFGVTSSVRSLTLADVDDDGDLDILVTCRRRPNQICLNDGKARFSQGPSFGTQQDSTLDVVVADLNQDGHQDLVLANRDGQQNQVLLNDGQLRFPRQIPFGTGQDNTRAVAVADLNGDGHLDLVSGNIGQPNMVFLGRGQGVFQAGRPVGRVDGRTYALSVADMDNDGALDLVVGNVRQANAVFFNQGEGVKYEEVRLGSEANATYGLATGDLDGDGFRDVVVANSDSVNRVFLSRPPR